jgi:TRAP-type C4-dicarboxylate transport system permease large subunit
VAVVYSLVLGTMVCRTVSPRKLVEVLYDSARSAAISPFAIGAASAFGWAPAFFQIPRAPVGEIKVIRALRDVAIVLVPMRSACCCS